MPHHLFNLTLPDVEPRDLLTRFDACVPKNWASLPVGLREISGGVRHPALIARQAVDRLVAGARDERRLAQATIASVPSRAFVAELTYWTLLLERERALSARDGRAPRVQPQDLFEVETQWRYEAAGLPILPPRRLPSGAIAEFCTEVSGVPLHVECKYVSKLVDDATLDRIVEYDRLARVVMDHVGAVRSFPGVLRITFTDPDDLPSDDALGSAAANLANCTFRQVEDLDRELENRAKRSWGEITIVSEPGYLVARQAGIAAHYSQQGIHPLDGYHVVRGEADHPLVARDPMTLCLPMQIYVALGPLPPMRMDELLVRQFANTRSKARVAGEPMISHLRLSLPERAFDLPHPFERSLRREAAMRTTIDRIAGTLDRQVPPDLALCEVSSWVCDERHDGSPALVDASFELENPASPHVGTLVEQLRTRNVLRAP